MANRYWVGGTGNWSDTAHWTANSDGTGSGASVPTSADSVYVNQYSFASDGLNLVVNTTANCLDLDLSGATRPFNFNGTSALNVYGNLTYTSYMTRNHSGLVTMAATSTGKTITMNGKSFGSITLSGVGGGWTLQDALTATGTLTHTGGTFDTASKAITVAAWSGTGSGVRTLTLGSSVINCTGAWTYTTVTNLTLTAHTADITVGSTFAGGGKNWYNVTLPNSVSITGANTYNILVLYKGKNYALPSSVTQTITSIFGDGDYNLPVVIYSSTAGTAATISTSGTWSHSYWRVKDIAKAGAGSITLTSSEDVSGNSNITFNSYWNWYDKYWVGGSGDWSDGLHWSCISGGSAGALTPTLTDNAIFDSNSFTGTGQTVTTSATITTKDFIWTGALHNPTFSASDIHNCYGAFTLISGMTYTKSLATNFYGSGNINCSTKTFNGVILFAGIGTSKTLVSDFITTNTITLTDGTLNTNGYYVSCTIFSCSDTTARTLTLSTSIIQCQTWTATTVTNLTLNYDQSTIRVTATSTFNGGGKRYYNLECNGAIVTIAGSNTFNNIIGSAGKTIKVTAGTAQALTGDGLAGDGTEASAVVLTSTTTSIFTLTKTSGNVRVWFWNISYSTVGGGATYNAKNSTNGASNTGWTFDRGAKVLSPMKIYTSLTKEEDMPYPAIVAAYTSEPEHFGISGGGTPVDHTYIVLDGLANLSITFDHHTVAYDNNGIMYISYRLYVGTYYDDLYIIKSTDTNYNSFTTVLSTVTAKPTGSHGGGFGGSTAVMAFDSNNDLHIAWANKTGQFSNLIFYYSKLVNGAWLESVKISDSSTNISNYDIAIDDYDNIFVVWTRSTTLSVTVFENLSDAITRTTRPESISYGSECLIQKNTTNNSMVIAFLYGTVKEAYTSITYDAGVSWTYKDLAIPTSISAVSEICLSVDKDGGFHLTGYESAANDYRIEYVYSADQGSSYTSPIIIQQGTTSFGSSSKILAESHYNVHVMKSTYNGTYWNRTYIRRTYNGWEEPLQIGSTNDIASIMYILDTMSVTNKAYYLWYETTPKHLCLDYIEVTLSRTAASSKAITAKSYPPTTDMSVTDITKIVPMTMKAITAKSYSPTWESHDTYITVTVTMTMKAIKAKSYSPTYTNIEVNITRTAPTAKAVKAKMWIPDAINGHTLAFEILDFIDNWEAGAGTTETNIVLNGHGLSENDFIVNTTRRTSITEERGSRLVYGVGLNENNIPLQVGIVGQAEMDDIRLYRYEDKKSLLKKQTQQINRGIGNYSEATFTLITTPSYVPTPGQYVRIGYPHIGIDQNIFWGILKSYSLKRMTENSSKIELDCTCVGLYQIPTRRTIRVNYLEDGTLTMGDIIADIVSRYLYQDGIRLGTIHDGTVLQDDWVDDAISISEVLDECAARSGFQWFVDNDGLLSFYQDPVSITDSILNLVDGGTFTDFKNVTVTRDIDGYSNKVFLCGGCDSSGDQIIISNTNGLELNRRQNIQGGTGVHGTIIRDASINSSNRVAAEALTTTTNINITGHGQELGWVVINLTRSTATEIKYSSVTEIINENNFTCDPVAGQTSGDMIVLFDEANVVVSNLLKKQSLLSNYIEFETETLGFVAGTRLHVNLAALGITNKYYLVETVTYFDLDGKHIRCRVKAVERVQNNFSTQRSYGYLDYFGGF